MSVRIRKLYFLEGRTCEENACEENTCKESTCKEKACEFYKSSPGPKARGLRAE